VHRWALVVAAAILAACAASAPKHRAAEDARARIDHIVVIFQENRSFDNVFGLFPGADGLGNSRSAPPQVDRDGRVYRTLPQPIDTSRRPPAPDLRFPPDLPNAPFLIDWFAPPGEKTGDLVHRFYQQQHQINGGRMDKFVAWSDAAGLVMGHYDGSKLATWALAKEFTLLDRFHHAAFGGSFLNHFWLVCACTPIWREAPADVRAQLDANSVLVKDGQVTPDGFVVNTAFSTYQPHPSNVAPDRRVPPQTLPTIGDRLSEARVSWAWYSGGWNNAIAGKPDRLFQFHHQPLAYFRQFGDGTAARREHLKDEADFLADVDAGRLPAVVFVKPIGENNEHPGYADIARGQQHAADLVRRLQASPAWKSTVIIMTHDENGGFWDHVTPPVVDRWGPGARVPSIVVSPFSRRGVVDHTVYDTTSILRFIEWRHNLAPLGTRDAAAANLLNTLDFKEPK
jgi:phospholipase C